MFFEKKLLSAAVAASLAASIVTVAMASADDTYKKDYTIRNVLSDYQYFVKENFTGSGHTVGAIAVGGTLDKQNTFGDGQIVPSFIGDVKTATFGNGNFYNGTKTVYYGTNSTGGELGSNFEVNPDYIDMQTAFDKLIAESQSIPSENDAYTVTADELGSLDAIYGATVLTVDVSNKNIVLPWSVYSQCDVINLVGFDNADYFKTNEVFISFVDVPEDAEVDITFGYGNQGGSGKAFVAWNGQMPDNYIMQNMTGGEHGGEITLEGFKLVWNFPDALK